MHLCTGGQPIAQQDEAVRCWAATPSMVRLAYEPRCHLGIRGITVNQLHTYPIGR